MNKMLTCLDISSTASLPLVQGPKYCSSTRSSDVVSTRPKIESQRFCPSVHISEKATEDTFTYPKSVFQPSPLLAETPRFFDAVKVHRPTRPPAYTHPPEHSRRPSASPTSITLPTDPTNGPISSRPKYLKS